MLENSAQQGEGTELIHHLMCSWEVDEKVVTFMMVVLLMLLFSHTQPPRTSQPKCVRTG